MRTGVVYQALREGYHTALMKGRYPVAYLFIDMDPAAVDVNVHPAKREVRFREPGAMREALVAAVRRTLEAGRADWTRSFHQPPLPASAPAPAPAAPPESALGLVADRREIAVLTPPPAARTEAALPDDLFAAPATPSFQTAEMARRVEPEGRGAVAGSGFRLPTTDSTPAEPPRQVERAEAKTGPFKILGVLNRLYILMENAGGLVLVDQHAAHERILFEELRRRLEANEVPSQKLLLPQTLQLGPRDADWLRQNLGPLQRMGIGLGGFRRGARSSSTACRPSSTWPSRCPWCARSSTPCRPWWRAPRACGWART